MPEITVEELKRHKVRQAERLLRLGVRQDAETLVCGRYDGRPQSPRAFLLLGGLALQSGRPQAAVASFREALRLDPENQAARAALQEAQRRR